MSDSGRGQWGSIESVDAFSRVARAPNDVQVVSGTGYESMGLIDDDDRLEPGANTRGKVSASERVSGLSG